ncbi:MAG TPA: hypothetical protein PLD88_02360 [Candidatus Berkiella sp.]|nr:hypothetical protein [Candidatus Berkiella sp.]
MMSQRKWLSAVLLFALTSATSAFAIEGSGGADRDRIGGNNWDRQTRSYENRDNGYYYQDHNLRARHQQFRDDRDERQLSTDFDVQDRMNN